MLHRIARSLSAIGMILSALVLAMMLCLTLTEVFFRNVLGTSTFVMNELVGYGVAVMTMVALGHSLERGALIRMNLLLVSLDQKSLIRRVLEVVAILAAMLVTFLALKYFLVSVERNYVRGYVSETAAQIPLWIPEAIVVAGLMILMLQLISYLLRVISGGEYINEAQTDSIPPSVR